MKIKTADYLVPMSQKALTLISRLLKFIFFLLILIKSRLILMSFLGEPTNLTYLLSIYILFLTLLITLIVKNNTN